MKECSSCKRCFSDDINHCPQDGDATRLTLTGKPMLAAYQLERRLGQGGMGLVFLARHSFLDTHHAIKIILPDLVGNDANLVPRFLQEARTTAKIRHSNIISVTDFGVERGTPFLVMEFINGRSLHEIIAHEGKMSAMRAAELIRATAAGLAVAHRQGVVHRDVKSANIMIKEGIPVSEGLKILDFGIAKIRSGELLGSLAPPKSNGLMGSPLYMAPEQWNNDELTNQVDVYSLGILLFQLLAGKVPFDGRSIPLIMKKHLTEAPPTFKSLGLTVPSQIEAVVMHALEKDVNARTPSVEAFVDELNMAFRSLEKVFADPIMATVSTIPADTTLALPVDSTSPEMQVDPDTEAFGSYRPEWNVSETIGVEGPGDDECEIHRVTETERWQSGQDLAAQTAPAARNATACTGIDSDPDYLAAETQAVSNNDFTLELPKPLPPQSPNRLIDVPRPVLLSVVVIVGLTVFSGWCLGGYQIWLRWPIGKPQVFKSPMSNTLFQRIPRSTKPVLIGISGSIKPVMIPIEGGTFKMGHDIPSDGYKDPQCTAQGPQISTTVATFLIQRTEVTNQEYSQFVLESGYPPPGDWFDGKPPRGEELLPVRRVSYLDAVRFAQWRSKKDRLNYRLPSEQEFEFAARNRGTTRYPWGNDSPLTRAMIDSSAPAAVGSYPRGANHQGVLDLVGNLAEWTSTPAWLYPNSPVEPLSAAEKEFRIVRGKSYQDEYRGRCSIASSARKWFDQSEKHEGIGFRLVREP